MGPTSPEMRSLTVKHLHILKDLRAPYASRRIESPLDLSMMEIEIAARFNRLEEIVT
jgi:hypothetical protein